MELVSPGANPKLPHDPSQAGQSSDATNMNALVQDILSFCEFGNQTIVTETVAATFGGEQLRVPTFVNEFWTAKEKGQVELRALCFRMILC